MAYKPRLLTLAESGTGAALTASNGGILYSNASTAAVLSGTATANQVLLSGSSTTPAWSTATYPATAGTSGNLLQSNGTNWVSTTPVYNTTNFTITNAQLKAATNVTILPAAGAGSVYVIVNFILKMNYGGTNVFTNNQNVYFQYGTTTTSFTVYNLGPGAGFWQAASSQYFFGAAQQNNSNAIASFENAVFSVGVGGALTGNAANDNTVTGNISWYKVTV